MKNLHFGGALVFRVNPAVLDMLKPLVCKAYADLAEYWPSAVSSQVILSSYSSIKTICCSLSHNNRNSAMIC